MADLDNMTSGKRRCVGCGAELAGNTPPDLCPKCLLKLAMETQAATNPAGMVMGSGAEAQVRGLPQPGEQFGHYTIIRALGAGGMGAVYEAEDLESGRRVALKVLSHRLDSPESRERFFREGRLAASINHPNSVYIFGTEEVGGTPVITMELVSGGTLQDRVRARGPLPVGEAVDCVLQIVEGLEAAQRVGILHRDVKPSNCYVGEDRSVKIGDFGLSISTGVRTEPALTATGAFLGTPAFCSPEQLRGEELDARSDMYSVGATLFYLLTGRTPFEAKNMVQLLATVLEQRAPSPRQFRPDVPKGLAKVVLRCLEKQSGERFKSYGDLAQALAPYSSTAPTPATLGLRFLAGAVDLVLLCVLAFAINISVFGSAMVFMDQALQLSPKMLACVFGYAGAAVLYYAVLEGLWGAAAGKALCRLRVVGPDRNPPGFARACLRALIYVLPPFLPYWLAFGTNPKAYLTMSQWTQMLIGASCYVIMALLFVTARRRNGFAAVQDLVTGTRVVSRTALSARPALPMSELPSPAVESALTIGPYHVIEALGEGVEKVPLSSRGREVAQAGAGGSGGGIDQSLLTSAATREGEALGGKGGVKWFLAYDLKLLRKVWLREVSAGTEAVPARLRGLGRIGRLRWLTGKRSAEENWDAFEAPTGRALLELVTSPQPWREVRYWLHDLATEISTAEKDGTLPELALDRVWITAEGRAKLLDFSVPGLAPWNTAPLQSSGAFLNAVAAAALTGSPAGGAQPAGDVHTPLPVHARVFLKNLSGMASVDAVVTALKPLLSRVAAVSRLRRAALVAGCVVFPVLASGFGVFGLTFFQEMTRRNPGLMDLSSLLQMRTSARFWGGNKAQLPTDSQYGIYIAHHYAGIITNAASWSSPYVMAVIKGDARKFAEQSVAEHSAPTAAEVAEADATVGKFVPKQQFFAEKLPASLLVLVTAVCLLVYVGVPAVIAVLLFRGGVVLLIAGVTYVRKDGLPASRLRLFWRSLVAWSLTVPMFALSVVGMAKHLSWEPWLGLALLGLVAAVSVNLRERGLQDRLAGTWPVPR
jgi:eukaryotic-like serine/threonine-protein kinase